MNTKLEHVIKEHVIAVMGLYKGSRAKSAKALGISVRTLRNWVIRFDLKELFPVKNWPTTREKLAESERELTELMARDYARK